MAQKHTSNKAVIEVLQEFSEGKVDEETIQYMAGMINEETIEQLTSELLCDLIGPFFIDFDCVSDDAGASALCKKMLPYLQSSEAFMRNEKQELFVEPEISAENAKARQEALKHSYVTNTDDGFSDPFLGLKAVSVNYNKTIPIAESIRLHKAAQKEKERKAMVLREWERLKHPLPPLQKIHTQKDRVKVSDIMLDSISLQVAGRDLLKDTPLKLVKGKKYGLVGRNGIGKSSLLRALVSREIQGVHSDISFGCVEQELTFRDTTVLQCVLDVDVERTNLLKEMKQLEATPNLTAEGGKRLAAVFDRLDEIEADKTEELAVAILTGLGIPPSMQHRDPSFLSGGERMRVVLARALLADPDILLLDEPSNHLDLHAVLWLTQYLQSISKTVLIVSHARQLLNEVCSEIILFQNKTLKYFKGNYDQFEQSRAVQLAVQKRQHDAQDLKKKHMQQFVDKFRYNAKRASLVQSRLKALQKLPMIDAILEDPTVYFEFGSSNEPLSPPILQLDDVSFSYSNASSAEKKWILSNVTLSIDMDSRIALCGVNGSGKTTLLSVLMNKLEPQKGRVIRNGKLKIGFYSQDHLDQLDLTLNSVQQLQERYPEANLKEEDARTYLARFGITKTLALEPLYVLSGGQKSRVCISLMAFKNPNLLILDEPTNHLDMDAIQALLVALKSFDGGVVVVSHDAFFLEHLCEEIWHIQREDSSCKKVSSSFLEYWSRFLKNTKKDLTVDRG